MVNIGSPFISRSADERTFFIKYFPNNNIRNRTLIFSLVELVEWSLKVKLTCFGILKEHAKLWSLKRRGDPSCQLLDRYIILKSLMKKV